MPNNNTRTSLLYEQRLYYKYTFQNIKNEIDFWANERYYGKLDKQSVPFYLNKQFLKSISTATITNPLLRQTTLNIVSDSFKEMNDEFKKADLYLTIAKSIYNPLKIKKTTLIFEDEYINYFRQLLNLWYSTFKNQIDNEITNFDDFVRLFINTFLSADKTIITQSAYLTSYLASPSITGLSIEISSEKHDDDSKKINTFMNDPNYQFFLNTTSKYSFFVDKNAPWRLVYNLSTDYAKGKMNKYNIEDIDDLFSKYYVYPHLTEYKKIRDELINFYSIRTKNKSSIQKSEYCHKTKGLLFETVFKNTNTTKEDIFWIQMYYYIRSKEEQNGLLQSQFDANLRKIHMIYTSSGEVAALNWILNQTKKFLDGGTNPSYFQYKPIESNKNLHSTSYSFSF